MAINYWQNLDNDCFYHIYNRSVDSALLFRNNADYIAFLKKYSECFGNYFSTYAYCLVPNHFHFIIKVKSKEEVDVFIEKETTIASQKYMDGKCNMNIFLSDQMRRMFSSYSKRYNGKYKRRGPLFSEKIKRVWISNDDRLKYLISYVHHNPIHHNLRSNFTDWKFSSFNAHLSDKMTNLARNEVHGLYGDRNRFLEFHREFRLFKLEEEIDEF